MWSVKTKDRDGLPEEGQLGVECQSSGRIGKGFTWELSGVECQSVVRQGIFVGKAVTGGDGRFTIQRN